MKAKNILIHIGYHKTGSTFLQEKIFQNPESGFSFIGSRPDYFEQIILVNPFTFNGNQVFSFFEPELTKSWDNSLIPVFSYELFSGELNSGDYNSKHIADRLKASFPEGKVLIVIREQSSIVKSIYKHLVRSYLDLSLENFLEQIPVRQGFKPAFKWEYLEYHWLISYYMSLFGKNNVLVLPQELLKANQQQFITTIADFSGVDVSAEFKKQLISSNVNEGYGAFAVYLKKYLNRFADKPPRSSSYRTLNNKLFWHLNRIIPRKIDQLFEQKLSAKIKITFADHYKKSNLLTQELTGLDLKSYGYKVS